VAAVPSCDVGLVLGTSKDTRRGTPNLHFNQRIQAAVASYRADVREQLARSWCAVDLCLLHRGPKFLGTKEPILLTSNQP
jgi:vancomycin permeability regulator SanA